MASEKIFENRIKCYLKNEGCWYIKYWGGGEFTKAGIPDILCCCYGHFFGIEVKGDHGRPSKLQLYNLQKIDDAGGFGILLYPKDFKKLKKLFSMLKQEKIPEAEEIYEELKGVWMKWKDTISAQ